MSAAAAAACFALALLALILVLGWRARRYVARHPELLTHATPRTYQLCQDAFRDITARYHTIKGTPLDRIIMAWQAPDGLYYLLTTDGIEQRRSADDYRGAYRLRWDQIGGVGLRMQPGFRGVDWDGDRSTDWQQISGYSFHLMVVPASGRTLDIGVPTDDRADAVEFVAHMVALAEQKGKRVSALGFDRPPVSGRQRARRF